jgi:hypothetical protein
MLEDKGEGSINNIPESLVVKIWQYQMLGRTDLVTEDGEPIKVIYPGRINDNHGADLRDAVIATSQRVSKGDIEVHVKSSDWRAHRHHQDPTYNRVILHVVMWRNTGLTTGLQNGENIPILALHRYVESPASQRTRVTSHPANFNMPCYRAIEQLPTSIVARFLDNAGEERFLAKAARFQAGLAQSEASQLLYEGIMAALGYSKNKLPFLELAGRLPLQTLESLARGKIPEEECLARQQALLLGTAGLLPSQRPHCHLKNKIDDQWAEKLEKLWALAPQPQVMPANSWRLFKVRPSNYPVRRIAAMSYLTLRYREKGLFIEVVNKISGAAASRGHHGLEKALMITAKGYWAVHFDFGAGIRLGIPTLLGRNRAADIVVNVLLPFTFAWSNLISKPELARQILNFYRHYPRLIANAIERHMSHQLGLTSDLVDSAQRQQGLIHIYNTLCSQGECHRCPLGGAS